MDKNINNESMASLKRNIQKEIQRIDHKIVYITKLKDDALENLQRQKNECREKELIGEIDEEIGHIQKQHAAVLMRQTRIHSAKKDYYQLEETLADINNELMTIQERHDNVMQQLGEKRDFLQARLGSIEAMDNMKVKIDEDLERELETYEEELERLKLERQELLKRTDMSPSAMELALRNIDEQIEQLERAHIGKMSALTQASSQLQAEFSKAYSSDRKNEILQELEKLKQQALNATPSELLIIEARIEELNKELEQVETLMDIQVDEEARTTEALLARGLKMTPSGSILTGSGRILTIEESKELGLLEGIVDDVGSLHERDKLNELLEQRGLTLTPSGRIQMENGQIYSMEDACKLGLLQGLEEELMKMRGISLTASGHIRTKDGRILSREEAERMGLLAGINLDELYAVESESESITESIATSTSGMSSADVHYLKTVLGRPLAIAMAEITAKQPRDPIHYLAHWLYKYRYNEEVNEVRKKELADLLEERERLAKEALRQQAEADARDVLLELLRRLDDEVQSDDNDKVVQRIAEDEAEVANEAEETDLESEARDTLGVYRGPTRGQQLI